MSKKVIKTRLNPLHAVVFACIFQSKTKAGTAMLEFLNAILVHVGEEPVEKIISMKSEYPLMGDSAYQKYARLDIRVKAASGRLFDIEVQIEKDFMNERGFFYGGRMGHDEFRPGDTYDKIPTVRVINICDFYVRDDDHSNLVEPVVFVYGNDRNKEATSKFKMYHIQLPVFRKNYPTLELAKKDALYTWLYMLDKGYKDPKEMEALSEMTEGLRNFAQQYNIAINSPTLVRRYRMYEDGQRDVNTRIATAASRAKAEEKEETARNMKKGNEPPEKISLYTGLTLEQIKAL